MSFSKKIKEELSRISSENRECQVAESAALISMCGAVVIDSRGRYALKIHTENLAVARKCFTLFQKSYNIETDVAIRINQEKHNVSYYVIVKDHEKALQILEEIHLLNETGDVEEELNPQKNILLQKKENQRAFLRGAFLTAGSMTDPEKSYHFEIACATREKAEQIQKLMQEFALDAKIVPRKKNFIVYLKEGTQIADALNVMGAHVALMEYENIRILKEMRNEVNRKVNCETANLNKTVSAAVKQIEDIKFIETSIGLGKLPEGLRSVAEARLSYPDASLKELGELVRPAVGKSGINHRLRKLSEMAEKLRSNKEGFYG